MHKQKPTIGGNVKKYRKLTGVSQGVVLKRTPFNFYTTGKVGVVSTLKFRIEIIKKLQILWACILIT